MKNVNTFMYKRLMPMFALMISTQAFAEEITYPFGHPFDDHLYNPSSALRAISSKDDCSDKPSFLKNSTADGRGWREAGM